MKNTFLVVTSYKAALIDLYLNTRASSDIRHTPGRWFLLLSPYWDNGHHTSDHGCLTNRLFSQTPSDIFSSLHSFKCCFEAGRQAGRGGGEKSSLAAFACSVVQDALFGPFVLTKMPLTVCPEPKPGHLNFLLLLPATQSPQKACESGRQKNKLSLCPAAHLASNGRKLSVRFVLLMWALVCVCGGGGMAHCKQIALQNTSAPKHINSDCKGLFV